MKTALLSTSLLVAAMFTQAVSAQDNSLQLAQMDMKMGMPGKAMPMEAKPAMDADKQMPAIQANMAKMQRQMDAIATTTDPKERQKLMQTHMQTMQENMKAMREMGGSGMKGGSAPMAMGNRASMPKPDMQMRQDMAEKRMDMMQEMMDQMMQREKAMMPMGGM